MSGEIDLLPFVTRDPGPCRDVGDRIVAGQIGPVDEAPVHHPVKAVDLVEVALDRVGNFFAGVAMEMIGLAEHRPEAADLPEQPLVDLHAAALVVGIEQARLARQILQRHLKRMCDFLQRLESDRGGTSGQRVCGMNRLNIEFDGELKVAIAIFKNEYPKKFLHQLLSGQLDVDRMDYLTRDSFFTGVSEGVIGYDRIIKMLAVHEGELVVEEKAIYSIEKFLVARRLMYWQVYLHKTVLGTELVLVKILERAKELGDQIQTTGTPSLLQQFLL